MKITKEINKRIDESIKNLKLNPLRVSIKNMNTYAEESRQFLEEVRKIRLKEEDKKAGPYEYIEYLQIYTDGISKVLDKLQANLREYYMEPEEIYDLLNTKERFDNEMSEVIYSESELTMELYLILIKMSQRKIVPNYYSELLALYNYMITLFENIKVQMDNATAEDYKNLIFYQ